MLRHCQAVQQPARPLHVPRAPQRERMDQPHRGYARSIGGPVPNPSHRGEVVAFQSSQRTGQIDGHAGVFAEAG